MTGEYPKVCLGDIKIIFYFLSWPGRLFNSTARYLVFSHFRDNKNEV